MHCELCEECVNGSSIIKSRLVGQIMYGNVFWNTTTEGHASGGSRHGLLRIVILVQLLLEYDRNGDGKTDQT